MASPESRFTYWQSIGEAADRGELFLNSQAAAACNQACIDYLARLQQSIAKAKLLAGVNGWGEFESGKALRKIYADKAVGGENNMVDVLHSHVEVVQQMQAVFKKFFVDTGATDDGNAADLGNQEPK